MPIIVPYDRQAAVDYAHRWAYGRNPAFYDFQNLGGDCTNFASQCLYAGTGIMNFTPVFGWYYRSANDRTPSWTGVIYFYQFLVRPEENTGPFAVVTSLQNCLPGDFAQLSLSGPGFQHTPVIVEMGSPPTLENTLVAAHTNDADYRPLSTYPIREVRFLHVLGARRQE